MPSTAASAGCKRRMISDASDLRSSRGFRLIWRRPLFGVMLVPSTPMNDDRLATSGSFRMIRASACWRSAIVGNETTSGASEMPRMTPVSWSGEKPLDRKSTRLNSSHLVISYAVFCLKKKKKNNNNTQLHQNRLRVINNLLVTIRSSDDAIQPAVSVTPTLSPAPPRPLDCVHTLVTSV